MIIILVFLLRAGELYTQIGRYQRYWDRINSKPVGKDDLVYIAFGDSAAQGVGASSPQKGYVGRIADQLASEQGRTVHVINLSKSGAKIKDVLDTQLPKYERLHINNPKIFTIEIGANDILAFEPKRFSSEVDELMSKLPTGTIMSDIPSFKGSRLGKHNSTVVEANVIIHSLAKKHGLQIVDLYDQVAKNHGIRTFGGDFFHPSNYGYKTNWQAAFSGAVSSRVSSL